MKTRVITAVVCIALFIPVLIFSNTIVFPLVLSAAAVIGVYEMHKCIDMKKWLVMVPSLLYALALPLCARIFFGGMEQEYYGFAQKIFVVYVFIMFAFAVFSKGKIDISGTFAATLTTAFIVNGFASIVLLRDFSYGKYFYLLVFLCPWITDTFAYFTGYFFGKHKLIPDVSPKKTVEGALGGTICCALMLVLYGFVLTKLVTGLQVNYFALAVIGIVLSIVSQCGDLIFSLVKRKYGIKDYGTLMPGHGGVLDRFDSVIATAPFVLMMFSMSDVFKLFEWPYVV
ncbi:MAG: phosphatidate cytidylyltransferase [Clostridia bacterium]|nr:phosphatidate cytidylyltransferase [Clostridia bacterium]